MKQFIILTIIGIVISISSSAQTKGTINGTITTNESKTYAAASVELLKAKDSSLVKIATTDNNGHYSFEQVPEGRYLVRVSAVGHVKAWSPVIELNAGTAQVTPLVLEAQTKDLKAVTVTAQRPMIEQKIDRTIVNVDASVTNVGASALEVLEKSPGITVDKDGNVSLKGKQGVQIYIDGKPSYLSGADLVNLLRNMNASQLDQIEIMTNPPAKYDAAGNAGIINIKTKKNKVKGFNGTATAGFSQGAYPKTNESLNMNYRNGKYNVFMNYNFNDNKQYQELVIHRSFRDQNKIVSANFDQVAFMPRNNANNNLKMGMDYFVSSKTTIGIVTSGFFNTEKSKNLNTSYLKNGSGVVDSIVYSTGSTDETWKNGSVNLNFWHQFDSTGRELTANLDYSVYSSANDQLFTNISYDPNWVKKGQTDLLGDLPVTINIYSAKADYTHPFKNGLKFEAGVKSSYVNTDNAANYFNLAGNDWVIDYNKTNNFKYKENINAAYVNFSRQYKKLGVQAGLRFENTNYSGHQGGNPQKQDSSFTNTYNSLFPTVFFSYEANKNNQFGLSVGRRIDRPSYQDLNPFLFFLDNYTYESGNPFLKPQYTTNVELSHTFRGFLFTTVNYSTTHNYMNETFEQNNYATIVRQGNIGTYQNAGISVSAQVTVTKWWSASLYGNYNFNHFEGELYGDHIDVQASNVAFNANNQFHFKKGWSAEVSGFYRTKGADGQTIINGFGQASAGISKQVMKGKGSIRANIRDIFYTGWVSGNINFQQTEAKFENRRDTRVAGISFTWRFGKPLKGQNNERKKGGADDEQSRVKMN